MAVRQKLLVITGVLVCVILIFAAAIATYAAHLKRTTDDLRGDLVLLIEKQGSLADLQRLGVRYKRFQTPFKFFIGTTEKDFIVDPNTCTRQQCGVSFAIDNGLLAKLAIVNPSRFSSTVVVLDDRLAYLDMSLVGGSTGFSGGKVEFIPCCSEISKLIGSSEAYSFPTPIGKPYLRVRLSDHATIDEIGRATTFDTNCLLSRSSCDWPCRYLPLAWNDYKKQLHHGEIEYWESQGMNCTNDKWR